MTAAKKFGRISAQEKEREMMMKNGFKVGDEVQVGSNWYGVVKSVAKSQDGHIIAYFVQPNDGSEDDGVWVDYDEVVSCDALNRAFRIRNS